MTAFSVSPRVEKDVKDFLDANEPATALSIVVNEAAEKANKARFEARRVGCAPEEAVLHGIRAALAVLKHFEGLLAEKCTQPIDANAGQTSPQKPSGLDGRLFANDVYGET